ncbi:MAG: type I restriction enzyme HsdR N-terminal domain-containing protein [Chitinophagaceae bacterium]|nr:type I restriction enzyme HsdR N-terminal domain-containing protein [Chitinophagaceae bacterium]
MKVPDIRIREGKNYVYDPVRRKEIVLTPEEWVRQYVIAYLHQVKEIPFGLMSVEKKIQVGQLLRRYDVLVYKNDKPWMIVECKEEREKLSDAVLQQVLSYTSVLQLSYIVVTNGETVRCYDIARGHWMHEFPDYRGLNE